MVVEVDTVAFTTARALFFERALCRDLVAGQAAEVEVAVFAEFNAGREQAVDNLDAMVAVALMPAVS